MNPKALAFDKIVVAHVGDTKPKAGRKTYPPQYLHVRHNHTAQEWIMPLRSSTQLNLRRLVKKWIKKEFPEGARQDGFVGPSSVDICDYYAQIKLNGEPPESISCWASGGFDIKFTN